MKKIIVPLTLLLLLVLAIASCTAPTTLPQSPAGGTGGAAKSATEWVTNPTVPVYLNPKSQSVRLGSEFTVNLDVMPAGWRVSAGEFSLAFDSTALELVEIKPGNLLGPNPLVGTQQINNAGGTITYALARVGITTSADARGTLAILTFKSRATAKGTVQINIVKIGLANEKFEEIKGLKSEGSNVSFVTQ